MTKKFIFGKDLTNSSIKTLCNFPPAWVTYLKSGKSVFLKDFDFLSNIWKWLGTPAKPVHL